MFLFFDLFEFLVLCASWSALFLHELNNDKNSWMIRVRLYKMWESVNTKKNKELISANIIFTDEKVVYT